MLHEVYGWVPGKDNVRPTPAVRAQKELLLSNLDQMWASPADWVFHHVFNAATTRGADGKRAATGRPQDGQTVFKPNPYPYDVPAGTEHWVFWMASPEAEWPDDRIDSGLSEAVDAFGGGDYGARRSYRSPAEAAPRDRAHSIPCLVCVLLAVWYPNPKMSVPDPKLYHVQVFWRPERPLPPTT